MSDRPIANEPTRRDFIRKSTAAVVGGSIAASLGSHRMAHAAQNDTLKVGLVGCGGRGSGAAVNACNADPNAKLTAMCDLFDDRMQGSRTNLKNVLKEKYAVEDGQCFSGFDGYQQLMATDVDVVILATPPHFRPIQLKAAVEAGKHIFCEKPVAVDGPGCRSVYETVALAKEKKLNLVSGLCWRYDFGVRDTVNRILDGAIGELVAIQENYLAGTLWHRGRKPEWSEMEYQCRNWYYFTWLSGDHNVEQHVHSLDKAVWMMGDKCPDRCFGLGGRQVRTGEQWGNIYDHHAVCYEYDSGPKVFAYTRQQKGTFNNVEDYVSGTKGTAQVLRHAIEPNEGESRRYRGDKPSMYDQEHRELFAAIRAGEVINDGEYMTHSTLMAIMGRMACYTGQSLTREQVLNSKLDLTPEKYEFGDVKIPEVAMPGVTPLV